MGLDKNKIEEQIYKLKKIQENIHAILYALEENRQRMKENFGYAAGRFECSFRYVEWSY